MRKIPISLQIAVHDVPSRVSRSQGNKLRNHSKSSTLQSLSTALDLAFSIKECADIMILTNSVTRLFKLIVKKSTYVSNWKIQRVSPVHKRAARSKPKNYRPITVVDNLSAVFEDVVKPQFEAWAKKFIPDWQYGFITECGTNDYGAALTLVIQDQ